MHVRRLNTFHVHCLRTILDVHWLGQVTNEVLTTWQSSHQCSSSQLFYVNVSIYGKLREGVRSLGRPHCCFVDVHKGDLKSSDISPEIWLIQTDTHLTTARPRLDHGYTKLRLRLDPGNTTARPRLDHF